MITLTVTQFNGAPYAGARLSASFGPAGGTIGRANTNLLVLPDPEKTISRVHVEVVCRGGQFLLIDRGSNPVSINGALLAPGQEAPVQGGEDVLIGAYVLRVDAALQAPPPPAPRDDPFAALFGAGAAAAGARDPFANPFAPPPPVTPPAPWSAPTPRAPAASLAPGGGQIPDDWDPFAAPGVPAPAPRDSGGASFGRAEASLDGLFGLSPAGGGRDPLFGSPLAGPASAPNTMADADPLRAFGLAAPVPAASEADRGSDLYSPMPLPRTAPAARMHAAGAVPAVPADLGLAWGDDASASGVRTIVRPAVPRSPAAGPEPVASRPVEAPVPPAPVGAEASAGDAELLAALRRGLGVDESLNLQLSPVLMELLGALVRESVQGSIDLLVARAALKREVRAEVTIIAAAENNPLKFSPSADVALRHLLGQPVRGFMPPLPAMRDAFEDLRAHQFGVMAGMKAALEGVLARFEPAQLESRLSPPSMLASLLPASRKARLWELFNELFQQLRSEASDDFQELFGRAFLRAYEQYIDELHRSTP